MMLHTKQVRLTLVRRLALFSFAIVLLGSLIPYAWSQTPARVSANAPGIEATPGAGSSKQPETFPPSGTDQSLDSPLIFSDDFETYGNSSRWSNKTRFDVQRDVVKDGFYSARLTDTGSQPAYGLKHLDANYTRLYARVSFQVIEIGTRPVTLLQLRPTESGSVVAFQIQPSGQISYTTGATDITSVSTSSTTLGEWHDLQVFIDTTKSENNIDVWIDNNAITSLKQSAWLGNTSGVRVLQLGDNSAGLQSDIAFDNILVDNSFIPVGRQADPIPGTLRIQALPAWSGIEFELDNEIFTTDSNGVAIIKVKRWSTDLRSRIKVHDKEQDNSKISFSGWREWPRADTRHVYATFELWQPVYLNFVDTHGVAIDNSTIDSIVLKSSIGEIYTLNAADLSGTVLLISSIVNTPSGILSKPITYYVDQVMIKGANVVNRSQQRTTFEGGESWEIKLLFYQVKFQTTDAFFGMPLGKEIVVQAPDGSEQRYSIDKNGDAYIGYIPRGDYTVKVVGGGYSPDRPIRISRDQVVELQVISRLDFGLMIGAAAFVAIGLITLGRPFLVTKPILFISGLLRAPKRPHERRANS